MPGSPAGVCGARILGVGGSKHLGRAKSSRWDPRGLPVRTLGVCWHSHNMALTLSPQVFHLRHIQIHLPQHPPCVPRHCLSYGEAQCHGPGWAFAPSPKHCSSCTVLVPHLCSACALATASAKLSLKPNTQKTRQNIHSCNELSAASACPCWRRGCSALPSLSQSADPCLWGGLGRAPPAGRLAKGQAGGHILLLPSPALCPASHR